MRFGIDWDTAKVTIQQDLCDKVTKSRSKVIRPQYAVKNLPPILFTLTVGLCTSSVHICGWFRSDVCRSSRHYVSPITDIIHGAIMLCFCSSVLELSAGCLTLGTGEAQQLNAQAVCVGIAADNSYF